MAVITGDKGLVCPLSRVSALPNPRMGGCDLISER